MTTTYDPAHPLYVDQADVRTELTRVFDVCQGCRRCVGLCASFPTLFEMVDRREGHDAGLLTPADQDEVVGACYQCTLCSLDCPYTPGRHELDLDFPRLMLRAAAMQRANGITSMRARATTRAIGNSDRLGALATGSSIGNRIANARPGSSTRRVIAALIGVSAVRMLPPYAKQRFSTWFRKRPTSTIENSQARVTVFPTCTVEYQETAIGKDLVAVYERNRVECSISDAGCCGAPWLHAGDVAEFTRVAEKNTATLAAEVRRGTEIVVAQPTCSYVIRHDYAAYVADPALRADAELVAAHTFDAPEHLMRLHRGDDTVLDTDFTGDTVDSVTYHAPCHLRAQDTASASRDLIELTGARVELVEQCSGIDGMWGLRAGNEDISVPIARRLGERIDAAGSDVVAGDCHLANTAIVEQTGRVPMHPVQVIARAYGIPLAPDA